VPLLCVLKADGYGHGAALLAEVLRDAPRHLVAMLGVASIDEGAALRACGLQQPILLLSALLPEEAPAALDFDLTPTVFTPELARALQSAAEKRGASSEIHVKIDTGNAAPGRAVAGGKYFLR
jgi:alanine racemase